MFYFIISKMDLEFYKIIPKSSAHFKSRTSIMKVVQDNDQLLVDLSKIAFTFSDKNHYKAIWVFEMLAENNIDLIEPYIKSICNMLFKLKHQSSIRGISRILLFLHQNKKIQFTQFQEEEIIEIFLDWLIDKYVIVPKIVAMPLLYDLGQKNYWINE